jgi:hypothetical protein
MANSTSANLKLTVQATGENSGTWGQITNTNLLILEQAIGGYSAVAVNATTGATLTFSNGALSNGKNEVIKLTGTITGNIDVVIPDSVEKTYIIENGTSGAFTVTFKTSSGTGVTWAATDKGTKMVYSNGTDVVDTAFTDLSSDITPQLSGILDTNGNDIIVDDAGAIEDDSNNPYIRFQKTASAVNYFDVTNQATGSAPEVAAVGSDTNIDFNLTPKGIGRVTLNGNGKIQGLAEKVNVNGTYTSNINIDTNTQAVQLDTAAATANFTVNLRGDGSNSLDASMDVGESITVAYVSKQNATAYYNTTVQVDGSTVTPVWQGGSAPVGGNSTSNDVYTYTAIKTAASTFTVLAAQTQFA